MLGLYPCLPQQRGCDPLLGTTLSALRHKDTAASNGWLPQQPSWPSLPVWEKCCYHSTRQTPNRMILCHSSVALIQSSAPLHHCNISSGVGCTEFLRNLAYFADVCCPPLFTEDERKYNNKPRHTDAHKNKNKKRQQQTNKQTGKYCLVY